ncbi:MAG: hypothetical protein WCJ30_01410 [Deltaproteobacteria bacterium]
MLAIAHLALAGCAAAPGTAPSATVALRAHPSQRAMTRAFERAQTDARRCLRAGDRVTVRGVFVGTEGTFTVRGVDSPGATLPYAVDTCVRAAAERVHVRPFSDAEAEFAYGLEVPAASSGSAGTAGTGGTGVTGTMTIDNRPVPADLIRREADALQRCYEQACERDHTISGRVELRLTLDAAGHIVRLSTRVETAAEDASLMDVVAHCIESHVRLIQFGPQPFASQDSVVPLSFQPGGIPID